MTRSVISIKPNASVSEMVNVMLNHRISGLPVIDERGELVGIVTEGDCLRRTETETERKTSRLSVGRNRRFRSRRAARRVLAHEVQEPESRAVRGLEVAVRRRKRIPLQFEERSTRTGEPEIPRARSLPEAQEGLFRMGREHASFPGGRNLYPRLRRNDPGEAYELTCAGTPTA